MYYTSKWEYEQFSNCNLYRLNITACVAENIDTETSPESSPLRPFDMPLYQNQMDDPEVAHAYQMFLNSLYDSNDSVKF